VRSFLSGLLEHMGIEAEINMSEREGGGINVDLAGPGMGAVIGRRGETLDAIQHLTNYAVNHGSEKHLRVSVDAENYRAKREESLQRLAAKVAGKVVKYRRNITLEPMNAYERHVIHAALQETPGVTTYSTGTDPNRRVIVAYDREKK
jgi:spoIIIJ-associated protein